MRLKPFCLLVVTVVILSGLCELQSKAATQPQVANHAFAQNGHVQLHLEAGDYEIRPSAEDKIHVEYRAKNSDALEKIKVDVQVSGNAANVKVKTPNKGEATIIIEVPTKTSLFVRLSAGELKIQGVEGDKDIESHAGDIDMEIGDPNLYGPVDASVNFGDLDASAFGVSKGGIGRSLHHSGTGRYKFHAHLGAGDLRISR